MCALLLFVCEFTENSLFSQINARILHKTVRKVQKKKLNGTLAASQTVGATDDTALVVLGLLFPGVENVEQASAVAYKDFGRRELNDSLVVKLVHSCDERRALSREQRA